MTEMIKLAAALSACDIPFEIRNCYGTPQICYPSADPVEMVCDVICHKYSYGGSQGLLEIMGLVDEELVGDSVEGYLTARDVLLRILQYDMEKA